MSGKDKKFSFSVSRDADGKVKPVEGVTPSIGMSITVIPLTYGDMKSYKHFGTRDLPQWPVEDMAKLLREHVVEVDGDSMEDVTIEDIRAFEGFALLDILHAITLYSGFGRVFDLMEKQDSGKEESRPTLHQATGDSKDNSTT